MSDSDVLPFPATARPGPSEEKVAPGDAYATAGGQRMAGALEFIHKDGSSFVMPYGYMPLTWWRPPGTVFLEYPGFFTVVLRGKNLEGLKRRIRDGRVTWVREFDERQASALPEAVTSIRIVHAYPSHTEGSDEDLRG